MATCKIKVGDTVRVIKGDSRDRGKDGRVLSIDHKKHRVLVEGINYIVKHARPSLTNREGGRITREAPIDISNVMYVHKGKTTRVGFKYVDEKKHRYAKTTGELID